jgi:hypothetical protein
MNSIRRTASAGTIGLALAISGMGAAQARTWAGSGNPIIMNFGFSSGRRSDGGSSYARMADKGFQSVYPYGVSQYSYLIELCRDKALSLDPCSTAKRGWHAGL